MGFKKEGGDRLSCNKKHRERRPLSSNYIDSLKDQADALNAELVKPRNIEKNITNIIDDEPID